MIIGLGILSLAASCVRSAPPSANLVHTEGAAAAVAPAAAVESTVHDVCVGAEHSCALTPQRQSCLLGK